MFTSARHDRLLWPARTPSCLRAGPLCVIKMPGSTRYFDTIGREAGEPIEGFAMIEYAFASQDEWPAKYEPQFQSEVVESGPIQVWTRSEDAAPERVIGLFDIGTGR